MPVRIASLHIEVKVENESMKMLSQHLVEHVALIGIIKMPNGSFMN